MKQLAGQLDFHIVAIASLESNYLLNFVWKEVSRRLLFPISRVQVLVVPFFEVTLKFESSFGIHFFPIAMFVSILKSPSINKLLSHQFPLSMVQSILQSPLIILLFFLNKEKTIFGPRIEHSSIFDILTKINLNSVTVFDTIQELTVVYFLIEIVDDPLIDRIDLFVTKIDTIFVFLDYRINEVD